MTQTLTFTQKYATEEVQTALSNYRIEYDVIESYEIKELEAGTVYEHKLLQKIKNIFSRKHIIYID